MDNLDATIPLSQPVEFVDAEFLDKSIILSDGCTTATITTVDGQAVPVTFIVSRPLQESGSDSQSVQDLITSADCSVVGSGTDDLKMEHSKEDTPAVYAVHFPTNEKSTEENFLPQQETNLLCNNKSNVRVDNSFAPDVLSNNEDEEEELTPITRLEDFMDVVTTYKCKFCRFSCPWKAGLMSHIRCCHINEKQNIVTVKAEKDISNREQSVTFQGSSECIYNQINETSNAKQSKAGNFSQSNSFAAETKNSFSEEAFQKNYDDVEEKNDEFSDQNSKDADFHKSGLEKEDSNPFLENAEMDSDNDNSSSVDSPVERHIFLCGQCSDGFASLDECKQHMIEDHNLKLDQNEIKPLRKRGRPRKNFPKETSNSEEANITKEKKRQSRPPRILAKDFECGSKKKTKKE